MEELTLDQLGKRIEESIEDMQGTIRILVTAQLVNRGHASSWAEAADIPMARAVELLQSDLEKHG